KLENASFIDKAPEAVVAQEKKRLEEFEESFEKLNGQLKKLA
ncbi:MAG: valyl-tRNA synthetase, partial [Pseudomonadota bacterium]